MNVIIYFLIIFYIIALIINNKRYYFWYPSANTRLLGYGRPYPDSYSEIPIVMNDYILKKTQEDIDFFYLCDNDIAIVFQSIITEMTKKDMIKLYKSTEIIFKIYLYKFMYNRARPAQVAPNLINLENGNLLKSQTAMTPAYPSGHAFQAYYLAKVLSHHFPHKKQALLLMAKRVSDVRIIAGLHFPSDRDFAWWLVDAQF